MITGFGAGIVMAFADWMEQRYSAMPLLVAEMSGVMSFDSRVTVMDYLSATFPTIFLLWSSLRTADDYIIALEARGWQPRCSFVYLRGMGEENKTRWVSAGCKMIDNLWIKFPIGELADMDIRHPERWMGQNYIPTPPPLPPETFDESCPSESRYGEA